MNKNGKSTDSRPPGAYEILIVCTGNICRSPMAAGLLAHLLPPQLKHVVTVGSAGTNALHGHQAAPHAVQTMAEEGIDISAHRARQVSNDLVRPADLILTMERFHQNAVRQMILWNRARVRMLTEYDRDQILQDIPDPYGEPLKHYRVSLSVMRPCIEKVADWLVTNSLITEQQ
ncbi:MAG: hypothetical protein KJP07_13150 [Desulfatitalea sp.]|nr:hypothetical protein [Desulfatitalea sp.]